MVFDTFIPRSGVGAMDVLARDGTLHVLVDVPGFAPDDLDVRVDGRFLVVSGHRRRETAGAASEHHFERRVLLGADVREQDVTAHLADGVLRVSVPRSPRTRRIPIGAPAEHRESRLRLPWRGMRLRRGAHLRDSLRRLTRRS